MAVAINRDPFARGDLVRERILTKHECEWCGSPARFRYGFWRDDKPEPDWAEGNFCSVGCFRAYNL